MATAINRKMHELGLDPRVKYVSGKHGSLVPVSSGTVVSDVSIDTVQGELTPESTSTTGAQETTATMSVDPVIEERHAEEKAPEEKKTQDAQDEVQPDVEQPVSVLEEPKSDESKETPIFKTESPTVKDVKGRFGRRKKSGD